MKILDDAIKRLVLVALVLLMPLLFSCRGDRPQPFLNQSQMCDLMCEIRLAEAHLYQTREKNSEESNRVMTERALDTYVPIFQKYGINYKQFQAIENYYMHHSRKMEKIMRNVAEKLKDMQEEALQAASEAEPTQENS